MNEKENNRKRMLASGITYSNVCTVLKAASAKSPAPGDRHLQDVVPYCLKEVPESIIEWARWSSAALTVPAVIFLRLAWARRVSVTSMISTLISRRLLLQCSLKAVIMPI